MNHLTIHLTEKHEIIDTDMGGRLGLLLTANRRHLRPRDRIVETPRLAIGHEAVGDLNPTVGERRDRAGGTEVDIVGMGGHHE